MRIQHLILLSQFLPFFATRNMNKITVPSKIAVRPWITYKNCMIKEVPNWEKKIVSKTITHIFQLI
jgi:hypothetical protein